MYIFHGVRIGRPVAGSFDRAGSLDSVSRDGCLFPAVRRLRSVVARSFGRSFLCATVPQHVPSWVPASGNTRSCSGFMRPTPIRSIRPSHGTPSRSIIRNTPGSKVRSRGRLELARSRGDSPRCAANRHVRNTGISLLGSRGMLCLFGLGGG